MAVTTTAPEARCCGHDRQIPLYVKLVVSHRVLSYLIEGDSHDSCHAWANP